MLTLFSVILISSTACDRVLTGGKKSRQTPNFQNVNTKPHGKKLRITKSLEIGKIKNINILELFGEILLHSFN